MKIFCNNLKCKHCEKVENPEVFRKNKFFVPLFETYKNGECSNQNYSFVSEGFNDGKVIYKLATCVPVDSKKPHCGRKDCLYNDKDNLCLKDEIFVNQELSDPDAKG